jgi:hypothetical protein
MKTIALPARLSYTPVDLEAILQAAIAHEVETGGRYAVSVTTGFEELDEANGLVVNVWTHGWHTPATKEESTIVCSLLFSRHPPALTESLAHPGFDSESVWLELAALERLALGEVIVYPRLKAGAFSRRG